MSKEIGKYKLVQIRKIDGAQEYHALTEDSEPVVWLSGLDCTKNAKEGDVGTLTYESTAFRGWFVFTKDL